MSLRNRTNHKSAGTSLPLFGGMTRQTVFYERISG